MYEPDAEFLPIEQSRPEKLPGWRPTIALAGNPNSGKTSLFNALTGFSYKVANYPGVTVEKKHGPIELDDFPNAELIDLPGLYSLHGTSLDEAIASRAILGELKGEPQPDLVVAVLDASNLERNLYLCSQLIDLGLPLIVALNMSDIAESRGISIKNEILARNLGVPVFSLVASKQQGVNNLRQAINQALKSPAIPKQQLAWLEKNSNFLRSALDLGRLELNEAQSASSGKAFIVGSGILSEALSPQAKTSREAALKERTALFAQGIDPLAFEASTRYQWISGLMQRCCTVVDNDRSSWIDVVSRLCAHRVWGMLIFLGLMALIFQSIFMWASVPMDGIDSFITWISSQIDPLLPDGKLKSLLLDGVIAGVGSVLVFVPQIAILFFFIGLLEDSGYLSRAAFLMDRVMRKFGLQGRSFIPLLSSFACAIPGIMSTRTIPSFSDRLTTILVAPLMSCSARLPVYTVLISAFVPNLYLMGFISIQGLALFAAYLSGIIAAGLVARLLRLNWLRGEPAIFVMEMPSFKVPSLKLVLSAVWDRALIFIKNAGTVILACSIVLWFLASYPGESVEQSFAGKIGHAMEPIIEPLGYNWEIGVGILASFAAREVFVSSLSTVYNLQDEGEGTSSLTALLEQKHQNGSFTLATALSLLVFYIFACQCISTLAVCKRETGSWRWTAFMFIYMTFLAYISAFCVFRMVNYLS